VPCLDIKEHGHEYPNCGKTFHLHSTKPVIRVYPYPFYFSIFFNPSIICQGGFTHLNYIKNTNNSKKSKQAKKENE
jgi:hypothetical protein